MRHRKRTLQLLVVVALAVACSFVKGSPSEEEGRFDDQVPSPEIIARHLNKVNHYWMSTEPSEVLIAFFRAATAESLEPFLNYRQLLYRRPATRTALKSSRS